MCKYSVVVNSILIALCCSAAECVCVCWRHIRFVCWFSPLPDFVIEIQRMEKSQQDLELHARHMQKNSHKHDISNEKIK